jgi:hypothetical protein
MQTTAVPLALEDSPISRLIRQMARAAAGLPPAPEKKSGLQPQGLQPQHFVQEFGDRRVAGPDATGIVGRLARRLPQASPMSSKECREASQRPAPAKPAPAARASSEPAKTFREAGTAETRVYKGSTYVKGADGEWHLQQPTRPKPKFGRSAELAREEAPSSGSGEAGSRSGKASREAGCAPGGASSPSERRRKSSRKNNLPPVEQETPAMAWSTPAPIGYGTALSTTQLRAMAAVPGKFVYTPGIGEVLPVGSHTLLVNFTPNDARAYTKAECTVTLAVNKATPSISWPKPAAITYGTALTTAQLNATSSVPGRFVYTPSLGEVLSAGVQTLSVEFTPGRQCRLQRGAGHRVADGDQGVAGHHLGGSRFDRLWNPARRDSAQCLGIGSGKLHLHSGCR